MFIADNVYLKLAAFQCDMSIQESINERSTSESYRQLSVVLVFSHVPNRQFTSEAKRFNTVIWYCAPVLIVPYKYASINKSCLLDKGTMWLEMSYLIAGRQKTSFAHSVLLTDFCDIASLHRNDKNDKNKTDMHQPTHGPLKYFHLMYSCLASSAKRRPFKLAIFELRVVLASGRRRKGDWFCDTCKIGRARLTFCDARYLVWSYYDSVSSEPRSFVSQQ